MITKTLLLLSFIAMVLSTSFVCPPDYLTTPRGCALRCSSDEFADCPDFFTLEYNPRYCAVDKFKNWRSFTHACQACKSGYIAVMNNKCGCDVEPCQSGFECRDNVCVPENGCPANYIRTNEGCIQSCNSPRFSDCGDIFPALYDPRFCAVNAQGEWKSFTFQCQACAHGGFLGIRPGRCNCELEGCPLGQKCVNGECIQQPSCGPYQIATNHGCILSCNAPELVNCPDTINTLIYDPQYCGLRNNGQWISYTHICQACNAGGVGVQERKCSCEQLGCRKDQICDKGYCENPVQPECNDRILCPPGYVCNNNNCIDKCYLMFCGPNYKCEKGQCIKVSQCPCAPGFTCVNDKCVRANACDYCEDWEYCASGQCVDICLTTLCKEGTICVKGKCIPKEECTFNSDCRSYEFCLQGKCTDKCAFIRCQTGYICQLGGCIPNNNCRYKEDCPEDFVCKGGRCIDQCAGVNCPFGQSCQGGVCQWDNSICQKYCPDGQICRNGQCIDPCIFTTCPFGTTCIKGDCIDSCTLIDCGAGFNCQNGKCIKDPNICLNNGDCQDGFYCNFGFCVDRCLVTLCPQGQICDKGRCKPQIDFCPAKDVTSVSYCTQPRPTQAQCPNIVYIRAPDPVFCGVLADGTRRNFVRQCETCLDPEIVYYFDVPCHNAPFVCKPGQSCQGYYCGNNQCYENTDCPYDWQRCFRNKCIDQCQLLKCASCKFGQCGYQEPYGKCFTDKDCQNDWSCIGFECVDECVRKRCPPGFSCWKGECERD